ncbi:MAG: hypothetical protein U1E25_14595 [Methylocystis sp.]
MFDLASLDTTPAAEAGAEMKVLHPTSGAVLSQEDGQPIVITLVGEDSERFRRASRASLDRRLKRQSAGVSAPPSAEELENNAIETLVACTIGWSGIALDGKTLDCTPENARMIYKRLRWLREQVDAFINDRANFLKPSPST